METPLIEIKLSLEQWQQVLAILAQAPWATANPLIMTIGQQLQAQAAIAETRKPDGEDQPLRQ
jgi:hypothetical protein